MHIARSCRSARLAVCLIALTLSPSIFIADRVEAGPQGPSGGPGWIRRSINSQKQAEPQKQVQKPPQKSAARSGGASKQAATGGGGFEVSSATGGGGFGTSTVISGALDDRASSGVGATGSLPTERAGAIR